jgi:hypothetical protein
MKHLKKITAVIFCAIALIFSSCMKWDPTDLISQVEELTNGGMSGLGNNDGEIEGTDFQFPNGITIGNVEGYDGGNYYMLSKPSHENFIAGADLQLLPETDSPIMYAPSNISGYPDTTMGSGYYVRILLPLTNTTGSNIDVELPAALIFQNNSGEYQNGLLIKKVSFTVPANSTYYVVLHLYCCNLSRHASDGEAIYNRFVVCTNEPIIRLCELFKNKKINIEENPSNYSTQVSKIQSIVWDLTQLGIFPRGEDLAWINGLPNS